MSQVSNFHAVSARNQTYFSLKVKISFTIFFYGGRGYRIYFCSYAAVFLMRKFNIYLVSKKVYCWLLPLIKQVLEMK